MLKFHIFCDHYCSVLCIMLQRLDVAVSPEWCTCTLEKCYVLTATVLTWAGGQPCDTSLLRVTCTVTVLCVWFRQLSLNWLWCKPTATSASHWETVICVLFEQIKVTLLQELLRGHLAIDFQPVQHFTMLCVLHKLTYEQQRYYYINHLFFSSYQNATVLSR